MLWRTASRLAYKRFEGHVSGDKGHMTLQQACTIFGFQLDEEWNKKEIKKRFQKLAIKFHPDNGGSSEQFLALKEAQHIMLTHRHDKGRDRAASKGGVNFRRMHYDDMTNTIHRQTADQPEYRSFGLQDFAVFFVFISGATVYYVYRALETQKRVIESRWSYTEDQLKEVVGNGEHVWHPWRADRATKDAMDDIGIIQGSIRKEVVDRKRQEAPVVYMPWQSGGPFSRNMAPQYPSTKSGEENRSMDTRPGERSGLSSESSPAL